MITSDLYPTPIDVPPDNPTGQDTERNYRYQHAYGVILLIGAAAKRLPYLSIYAEHHEDFICERSDKLIDGVQIKTRKPEEGPWDLADNALRKSIKHFVELNNSFLEYIGLLKFVSNVDFSNPGTDIKDRQKLRRSPVRFLKIVKECFSLDEIPEPFEITFIELRDYCECSSEELLAALKKVELVIGPERNSFDSEIVTTHLANLSECSTLSVPILNAIRDELIHQVWLASHKVDDPSKHWYPINKISSHNPNITAKRIFVETVLQTIQDKAAPPFRYYESPTLALGNGKGNLEILRRKMEKGDLYSQVLTMERRSIAAEEKLIEFAIRNPIGTEAHLAQLEFVVQGECDEAFLKASLLGEPFGRQMLTDVYNRLKLKAEQQSSLVLRQPYELLVGISGLLTGECKVWWSEHFDLGREE
jgi:Cap4 dsDNA endonuclease